MGGFFDFLRKMLGWYSASSDVATTTPGVEWTLPANRLHYMVGDGRLHYAAPDNRLHYTLPEEDGP